MQLRSIRLVTVLLTPITALLTLVTLSAAEAQVTCRLTSRSDATYPILIEFSESVTGLTKRDFTVEGGLVEEVIPLVGNTSAARSALIRPTRRGSAVGTPMRISLGARTVIGRSSQLGNLACGPLSFLPKETPKKGTATPTRVASPTGGATSTPASTPTSVPISVPTTVPTIQPPDTATPLPTTIAPATSTPTEIPTAQPTAVPSVVQTVAPPVRVTAEPSATPVSTPTTQPTVPPSACSEVAELAPTLLAFPGAIGHGRFSVGGSGRHLRTPCTRIFTVTNRNDTGEGSLRQCIEARGPRTCVFGVGGQFWAIKELKVTNPYLTIAGQTAPEPGVNIRGATLSIEASEVIVRGIRMRVGDDPRADCCKTSSCSAAVAVTCTSDPGSRDGIRVYAARTGLRNILLDHISISWALDEGFSISAEKGDVTNVTFSHSIIGAGLDMSNHPEASSLTDPGHSKGVLIGGPFAVNGFSFIGNYLAHNADRNIRSSTAMTLEFINNIIFDWGRGRGAGRTKELTNTRSAVHAIDLVSNLYLPGKDTFCPETEYRPDLCFEKGADGIDTEAERKRLHYILRVGNGVASGLSPMSRYFLVDNIGPTRPVAASDEWDIADRTFYSGGSSLVYSGNEAASPVATSGSYFPLGTEQLLDVVPARVGARPSARDSVDSNLVNDVRSGNGRIINCVAADGSPRCAKNGGGWPIYLETVRGVTIPGQYNSDFNQNGYTDLEDELAEYSVGLGE